LASITSTTITSSVTKAGGDAASTSENRVKNRLTLAIELKNEGNIKYRENKFNEAIAAYTKAIEACPPESTEELSQFYQNRAAAWESLKNYDKVIEDCSRAIELNPKYIKCIQRRARAAEKIENFELALEDYSTVCFLDSYQPAYIMAADKVLTDLARHYIATLPPSTAELSKDYVRTSLNEFEDDPVFNPTFINEVRTTQPDSPLARAYQAYDECHFTDIPSLCTQELELSSSYKLQALLFRGSFYLLMGNFKEALADFDTVVNDPNATEKVLERLEIYLKSIFENLDEN
jgi:import receptor subunit TOM70